MFRLQLWRIFSTELLAYCPLMCFYLFSFGTLVSVWYINISTSVTQWFQWQCFHMFTLNLLWEQVHPSDTLALHLSRNNLMISELFLKINKHFLCFTYMFCIPTLPGFFSNPIHLTKILFSSSNWCLILKWRQSNISCGASKVFICTH